MDFPLLILFGSETGNAEDVAHSIARQGKRRGLSVRVMPMDAYAVPDLPSERAVVFVASTAGQGDYPANMKRFWKFLRKKSLPLDSLAEVSVAVFGLGDSGYVKYNVAARKLASRLSALGAKALVETGLGDDQHPSGYDGALDVWVERLWKAMELNFGVHGLASGDDLGSPKLKVSFIEGGVECTGNAEQLLDTARVAAGLRRVSAEASGIGVKGSGGGGFSLEKPYLSKVVRNQRITSADHFQDVRHIEFDLGASGIAYEPGDLLAIFPRTDSESVEGFLSRLGLNGDDWVEITARDVKDGTTVRTCIRSLVQGVLDISGSSPRRYFFEVLKHFAQTELEVERLAYFASPEGRDDLYTYNQREGRTVLEVLNDFKSACPPLEWILQICPIKQPRQFSISSSLKRHPCRAHITAAIVEWKTPFRRIKHGLCTSWLATLIPGRDDAFVPIWVEKGAMTMPSSDATPMLLIGPGTGVAPFRAFLQERHARKGDGVTPVGPSWLFFGCRNKQGDFYYEEEWEDLMKDNVLDSQSGLVVAFSRDQTSKVYVTHKIKEHGQAVCDLIQNKGACVYVAGSAKKMPAGVASAMEEVLVQGGMELKDAKKLMHNMESSGRYVVEAWS